MSEITLGTNEARFADIIWENEPISSTELAKKSEELLGWKKSTSFTVLKRLSEKGLFKNEKGCVTSLISKEQFFAVQSEQFVEGTFGGSLPKFIAAFTSRKKPTPKEIEEIYRMIESMEE